jgi:hypothetical protein
MASYAKMEAERSLSTELHDGTMRGQFEMFMLVNQTMGGCRGGFEEISQKVNPPRTSCQVEIFRVVNSDAQIRTGPRRPSVNKNTGSGARNFLQRSLLLENNLASTKKPRMSSSQAKFGTWKAKTVFTE